MSHLIYHLNEYCYRNYGLGKVISIHINYSWNVQLEIIHWACPNFLLVLQFIACFIHGNILTMILDVVAVIV
jgi:hypothetical protein